MPDMFHWRFLVKERRLYESVKKHIDLTYESIELVSKAVEDLCLQRYKQEDQLIEKILDLERQTEDIARTTIEAVTSSTLRSVEAHDLIDLMYHLERISKKTKGLAYRLDWAEHLKMPDEINEGMQDIGRKLVLTFNALSDSLTSLSRGDPRMAVEYVDEVCTLEEEIDTIRREVQKTLYEIGDSLSIGDFQRILEAIIFMEAIADACEEAAHTIRLITIKSKN